MLLLTTGFFAFVAAFYGMERLFHPIRYEVYVSYYAEQYHVPKEIVYAVMLTESHFQEKAVSRAGARGLMQLMPQTYREVAEELGRIPDDRMAFDPGMNICCGVYLLSRLYNKYHAWETVYAAYNAGEAAVDRWLADPRYAENGYLTCIPYSETAYYVKKVSRAATAYQKLYGW